MKSTASFQSSMFFQPTLPITGHWGESTQRISRRRARPLRLPSLNTDELAANKQEVVCGGILALCLFYTLAHCFIQLAS